MPEESQALAEQFLRHMPQATLTEQQRAALACVIEGLDASATARRLRVPPWSAKRCVHETVAALGFANTAQLLLRVGALCAAARRDYTPLFDSHGLTRREREICALLLTTGNAQKHIADRLCLSADTVKFHVKNIYRKLGVQSRTELIAKMGEGEVK